MANHQDLSRFQLPENFRGKSAIFVQIWWLIQSSLFGCSPQFAYGFRRWLLRCFGAKIGSKVIIRPSARITYPWKVEIGDHSWIGDDVVLYSLGRIHIGDNSVVSQKSYICAGDHNYLDPAFEIRARDVFIGDGVWVAADVFVAPGVVIGDDCVIGARSSVFKEMPAQMICMGSPCEPLRIRQLSESV